MAILQRYDGTVQDASGSAVPSASVLVVLKATGATATIYSDEVGTAIGNPIITGGDGRFWFYAVDGDYTITATYGGSTTTLGDVTLNAAVHAFASKAADETLNNDAVLQDDDDLAFAVYNGEVWQFELVLYIETPAAADFKWMFTTPGGSTGYYFYTVHEGDATLLSDRAAIGDTITPNYAAGTTSEPIIIMGHCTAGADGDVQLQWAQNAAVVGNTRVLTGSYLKAQKVD